MTKFFRSKTFKKFAAIFLASMLAIALLTTAAVATVGVMNVTARLSPDITIVIDGVARTFRNVDGDEVEPILYNGSIYLPVRAIGEIMGKEVNWDQSTSTATLADPQTSATLVTDADSFTSPPKTTVVAPAATADEDIVTEAAAKSAALSRAGLKESEVSNLRIRLERDDGRLEYEVDFTSGTLEYEVTVRASDGTVIEYDVDSIRD